MRWKQIWTPKRLLHVQTDKTQNKLKSGDGVAATGEGETTSGVVSKKKKKKLEWKYMYIKMLTWLDDPWLSSGLIWASVICKCVNLVWHRSAIVHILIWEQLDNVSWLELFRTFWMRIKQFHTQLGIICIACILSLGQLWHHKLLPIIIKGAANNYEPTNSLIQSLLECWFRELVVKDGSSAVKLKRRSLNDMSSDTRKFLTELNELFQTWQSFKSG